MKLLFVALIFVSSAFADTPAQIAADYHSKAAAALQKVNDTLEKATVPLIADLVKSGDTDGADLLRTQMKSKVGGDPVLKPQARAKDLFKNYDAARVKALEPAKKAAIARIDAMLASSEGKKLDVLTALNKVRAEIEAGKPAMDPTSTGLARQWTYHMNATTDRVSGMIIFEKGGVLKLDFPNNQDSGTWKKTQEPDTYETNVRGEKGLLKVTGQTAEWKREVGIRYLRAKEGGSEL
ncbi:MAG: hypothetical protein IAE77_16210 [Prosthecobacter sp.]|jgi:hypothetical protein|uniref:hypothetical protein n=1 Tax=Prosthecobacter sp. TaxID=1965333 RepID=UPI0019F02A7C|nr:hypothetical protein [Prosthecobacter sp.]MBE2285006.1 hypothetical protein [Prosthecobacter sp.]